MSYRLLWGALILTWGVGDLLTTALGLHVGLPEQHPLMIPVIEHAGILGLAVLKVVALALVYELWQPIEAEFFKLTPLYTFIFLGSLFTAGNAFTILLHTGAL